MFICETHNELLNKKKFVFNITIFLYAINDTYFLQDTTKNLRRQVLRQRFGFNAVFKIYV